MREAWVWERVSAEGIEGDEVDLVEEEAGWCLGKGPELALGFIVAGTAGCEKVRDGRVPGVRDWPPRCRTRVCSYRCIVVRIA